jgi:hypothetical protein
VNEVVLEDDLNTRTAQLEGALVYQPLRKLSAALGVDLEPSVRVGPPPAIDIPMPSMSEAMDLLASMNPERRKWLDDNVSWLDVVP